ncbi:tRNA (cytosine(72)-C(5))-methyltransferase NSUN6 [Harmonia axyridis]|uniref:tRNA (cytosine(72)-C(5))-methyltransferase NSUN6 n=1 Tax=Harmonia axyridis TaxID=115357 RepID=UPI001E277A13|nr:tRNA (cytosine(72)-C(5))-methyltransferase NSUN6 [Harmonia axyridis]
MLYPDSPFTEKLDTKLVYEIENDSSHSSSVDLDSKFKETFKWLCTIPKMSSFRVNKLKSSKETILESLKLHLISVPKKSNICCNISDELDDTLIIHFTSNKLSNSYVKEVIIDTDCGAAVLRGAHIFAPGVLGMMSNCQKGDLVSIHIDLMKTCKKGLQKEFTGLKLHIGNGVVQMPRSQLYGADLNPRGIAVEVSETISGCPQISDDLFPPGTVLLQNLPSVICVHTLDPQPNEVILDMCAAPGHKTTHIAALMKNQGTLIAIDKTPGKIKNLERHCSVFDAKVQIFLADSTKIFCSTSLNRYSEGPPFAAESFDRILLDAPCSALGKRPQFRNNITNKVLKSYVALQKKLFSTAVNLLKLNGVLVYSTCTITLGENEGIVAWALNKFDLELVKSKAHLGSPGLQGSSLKAEELHLIQRFGPDTGIDSIGFFIACFRKKR